MALVDGRFCIDRWEASLVDDEGLAHSPYHSVGPGKVVAVSRSGAVPQGYISLEEASEACARAGKKLCTTRQWVDACMGTRRPRRTYPYGMKHEPGACNDACPMHPVDRLFPGKGRPRDAVTLNDSRINQLDATVAKTGAHAQCVTPDGVFDMVGNLLEWTVGERPLLMGGHYVDSKVNGEGCTYVTPDHGARYHDFTTGFRCCLVPDPQRVKAWLAADPAAGVVGGGAGSAPDRPPPAVAALGPHAPRSFANAAGHLPNPPPPAPYEPADAKCPSDMVFVSGVRCGRAVQNCLQWVDPPGGVPGRACGQFEEPTVCQGARLAMRFCIDRYEFTAPGDRLPLVHVSFPEAEMLCAKQKKRMCEEREWEFACEGPDALPFPYGFVRSPKTCNHDLDDLFTPSRELVDRRVPFDALPDCKSPFGVLNLVGNADEWVLRVGRAPPWRSVLRGGWWLTGRNRCRGVTDSHSEAYAGPQTGFRCCRDARR
jgi:formylglycine-generating enzyme required for sulfatase activity